VSVSGLSLTGNSGALSSNYNALATSNTSVSVTPATLTVTANNATRTYNGAAYSGGNGVAYSGFVNSENVSVLGGVLAYGGSSQGAVAIGNYVIIPSGLTSGNYTLRFVNGVLSIVALTSSSSGSGSSGSMNAETYALSLLQPALQPGQPQLGGGNGLPQEQGKGQPPGSPQLNGPYMPAPVVTMPIGSVTLDISDGGTHVPADSFFLR
jgi:MBG domain (YGX type)